MVRYLVIAIVLVLGSARAYAGSCGSDSDCKGFGKCSSGKCGNCGSDSDCSGWGKCSSGKCGSCGSDSDCKIGKCSNSRCGSCGSDSDCKGGKCSSGRCNNAFPEMFGIGSDCDEDAPIFRLAVNHPAHGPACRMGEPLRFD